MGLYSALVINSPSMRSGMDHTVLPANTYTMHACLYLVSVHQRLWWPTSNRNLLLIYRPRKDERLSRPSWLICSGRLTHISGYPSAVCRAQDRKSLPVKVFKDQRSTTVPRYQLCACIPVTGVDPSGARRKKLRSPSPWSPYTL